MAEVKLKKVFIAGASAEKDAILKRLSYFGAMEVKDAAYLADGEESALSVDSADSYKLKSTLEDLSDIIAALTPHATKKGMLTIKPSVDEAKLDEKIATLDKTMESGSAILKIVKERAAIPTERARLEGLKLSLAPWLTSDLALSKTQTECVDVLYGVVPPEVVEDAMREKSQAVGMHIEHMSDDTNGKYFMVYMLKSAAEECNEVLREFSFSKVSLRGFTETPKMEVAKIDAKYAELAKEDERLLQELKGKVLELPQYEEAYDAVNNRIIAEEIKERLVTSEAAFYLTGFVPESLCTKLEEEVLKYNAAIEFSDVDIEADNPPVLLHNSALVQPYEMITELFSLPSPGGFDPNKVMAPFFFVFFGIMLGDIAYGLIMFALATFVLKKLKPEGFLKKMMGLIAQCGISTALFGLAFGSFFGNLPTQVANAFFGVEFTMPAILDPMQDSIPFLLICCAIGAVQILVGMGLKGYLLIKEGNVKDAIFDIGFWYVVFAGIGLTGTLAFTGGSTTPGFIVMGAGALGLILTQGRSKPNLAGKAFSGVLSLYGITSYLSDILSYSRLMALGIASAVMSMVFNTLATLMGPTVFGIILFVFIFAIGHTMNLAINALGAYVHSSRLQYVEFFGKFYEGGGRPFEVFGVKGKYNNITK